MSEETKKSEPTEKESELHDEDLEQVAGGDSASPVLFDLEKGKAIKIAF